MISKLPPHRLLIYALILGVLPLFLVGYHFFLEKKAWDSVHTQIQKVALLHETLEQRQSINTLVRKEFANADPYFFNNLSKLSFLRKEADSLSRLFASRHFTGNAEVERRYAFIASRENAFDFVEGNVQAFDGVQECEVSLLHSVEIDGDDLKEILKQIEQPQRGGPQVFFTDFRLSKKETPLGSEIFELNLKFLKREYR